LPDIDVVGEAGNGLEAVAIARELTPRELEVFQLLATGLNNAEILNRRRDDDQDPRHSHLMKLGVADRAQAVILAYETALTAPRRADKP
jgi:DNA-binding NarL/FixJ family response regulator